MEKTGRRIFLYAGLSVLLVAYIVKWIGTPIYCFWVLFGLAILLKVVFLVTTIWAKSFRRGLWFYFILGGVAMILTSLIFKNIFPIPILRNILFYGAILLKITGLILMFLKKKNQN